MDAIRDDMIGGFARFVDEQREAPGRCVFSLYRFDDVWDTAYEAIDVREVGPLDLVPRGRTALFDGMGKTMMAVGARLARQNEAKRPGQVLILVITDGMENASREWTKDAVAAKVKHQREKYNWGFSFLGANMDAWNVGRSFGFAKQAVATFEANTAGVGGMYSAVSNGLRAYRSAGVRGQSVEFNLAPPADADEAKKGT